MNEFSVIYMYSNFFHHAAHEIPLTLHCSSHTSHKHSEFDEISEIVPRIFIS